MAARGIEYEQLQTARLLYERAVKQGSEFDGWNAFEIWAQGHIASLELIAPGARDVIVGYAISYIQRWLRKGPEYDEFMAEIVLGDLIKYVPALDEATLMQFRDAGIPVVVEDLKHAVAVIEVHRLWESFQEDRDHLHLALVCKAVLVETTVQAVEIGTSEADVWETIRTWVAETVGKIKSGQYELLGELYSFSVFSKLDYEALGLTDVQLEAWDESRAKLWWTKAQAGDGKAAFRLMRRSETDPYTYESITGLPGAEARPLLLDTMEKYAADLRRQIEIAPRGSVRVYFKELQLFRMYVSDARECRTRDGEPLVDLSAWYLVKAEWSAFYDRYVRGIPRL